MGDSTVFIRRLKEARLRSGLSQEQLGVQAGIEEFSASARMNQYERGKHVPHPDMIGKIAAALDVPLPYFFAEEEALGQLLLTYGKLSDVQKRQLVKFAEALLLESEKESLPVIVKSARPSKKSIP